MGVYVPFAKRLPSSCDFCYISISGCEARDPYVDGRPNNCPLVEVKPHGRLIDADVLRQEWVDYRQTVYTYDANDFLFSIDDAMTIIEAEGEDG